MDYPENKKYLSELLKDKYLNHNKKEYSVSEISYAVKQKLEEEFSLVRIKGEISGLKSHSSGHIYLSLKDEKEILSAVCFKNLANKFLSLLEDGVEVICEGKISSYGKQSKYQLIISNIEPCGIGAIMKLIEEKRKQFEAEGLFDNIHKKPIPQFSSKIGIITSGDGVVINDIINRVKERFPKELIIYPVKIQGEDAALEIASGIMYFNNLEDNDKNKPEVIIIARGGGSVEDLFVFNDELIIRTAFLSDIPIISAVGHDTDINLIDYVSDKMAATPTMAAEIVTTPTTHELKERVSKNSKDIDIAIARILSGKINIFDVIARNLYSPSQIIFYKEKRLHDLLDKQDLAINKLFKDKQMKISYLADKIPLIDNIIRDIKDKFNRLSLDLDKNFDFIIKNKINFLQSLSASLESYNYKNSLKNGYAIIYDKNDKIIKSISEITKQDSLVIEMQDGVSQITIVQNKKN